jgi:hypothetical protein
VSYPASAVGHHILTSDEDAATANTTPFAVYAPKIDAIGNSVRYIHPVEVFQQK